MILGQLRIGARQTKNAPLCAAWLGEMTTLGSISRSLTIDGINGMWVSELMEHIMYMERMELKWNKVDGPVGIDEMEKIKLMALMKLIKLLEIVEPMKLMEKRMVVI